MDNFPFVDAWYGIFYSPEEAENFSRVCGWSGWQKEKRSVHLLPSPFLPSPHLVTECPRACVYFESRGARFRASQERYSGPVFLVMSHVVAAKELRFWNRRVFLSTAFTFKRTELGQEHRHANRQTHARARPCIRQEGEVDSVQVAGLSRYKFFTIVPDLPAKFYI